MASSRRPDPTAPGAAERIVILGNAGTGKTRLARLLAGELGIPPVHFDALFWLPGGALEKRDPAAVDRLVAEARALPRWVAEGVFGELAARFLDAADLLLWLDFPWETCRAGLLERGCGNAPDDPVRAEKNFQTLLAWSAEYWTRTDPRSHHGHQVLFDAFGGGKLRFGDRAAVDAFVRRLDRAHRLPVAGRSGRAP